MKILVVDDHILFREGLVNMLRTQPDMEIVGEAGAAAEAVALARQLRPDLVLLDYSLPDGSGPDAARVILANNPETNVVFLTIHDSESHLLSAIRSGAVGYALKDMPFSQLINAIRALTEQKPLLTDKMVRSLMHGISQAHIVDRRRSPVDLLSQREREVLKYTGMGYTNQEIAQQLFISINTVKNSLQSIFRKLNFKNRKEAAVFARQNEMV